MRMIAYGKDFLKDLMSMWCQAFITKLADTPDDEAIDTSKIDKRSLRLIIENAQPKIGTSFDDVMCDIEDGNITAACLRNNINNILSSVKNMGKILVLGNEQTKKWSESISNSHFIQMPVFSLGEDGERKLCEFVINNIDIDSKAIVLDVDEISKPELCLAFAMAIRLSILDIKSAALSPILFISRATQDILTGYKYSPIILTGCIAFDLPENASDALEVMIPLSPSEYRTKFLDVIKIIPNATEGRHSLANQWGADVLSRIVVGNETNNELIKKARLSLYFRYVRALSLGTSDIENIIQKVESPFASTSLKKIDAVGKKILLIDDEADKGGMMCCAKCCQILNSKPFKSKSLITITSLMMPKRQ